MYTALRATTNTVLGVLRDAVQADAALASFFGGGAMVVSANTPNEMRENGWEGISVWLYQIVRDEQTLNRKPRRLGFDLMEAAPLPFRLHYLITPIVANSEEGVGPMLEQALLGKVLQVFHDKPNVRGADLRDDFAGSDTRITLRLETLGLDQLSQVWQAIESAYNLSVSYEVTVVDIVSAKQPQAMVPVDSLLPEYGVVLSEEEL